MKSKVIVVSVRKPSNFGGAEIVWHNLKRGRFKFENICLDDKRIPLIIKMIPEMFHLKEIIASKRLLKNAASKNQKIIIYDKIFGWRKIKTKSKLICYNHGSYTMAGLRFKKKNLFVYLFYKYVFGFIEKRSYANADKIIAVSESVKDEIIDYFKVPKEKIVVINNGVDLKKFKHLNNKNKLRKKYHLSLNKRIILFPGRPSFGKGFDIAEKVLKNLGQTYFMLVLSDGSSKLKNIKFMGKISNEKVPEIYNCANLCLFPSRYEGNSVSVLESAACGTPLILSKTGLIKTEKSVEEFTCDSTKEYITKIKKLFDNDNLKKASRKWIAFSKKFAIEKQILELKKLIQKEVLK